MRHTCKHAESASWTKEEDGSSTNHDLQEGRKGMQGTAYRRTTFNINNLLHLGLERTPGALKSELKEVAIRGSVP